MYPNRPDNGMMQTIVRKRWTPHLKLSHYGLGERLGTPLARRSVHERLLLCVWRCTAAVNSPCLSSGNSLKDLPHLEFLVRCAQAIVRLFVSCVLPLSHVYASSLSHLHRTCAITA